MAYLRWKYAADGKKRIYIIQWKEPDGKVRRKSLGKVTKDVAKEALAAFDEEKRRQKLGLPSRMVKYVLLSVFKQRFLEFSKATKAHKTYLADKRALENLLEYVGDLSLEKITKHNLEGFIRDSLQRYAATSVNIDLRQLKASMNKAVEWNYLLENPIIGVKPLQTPDSDLPKFLEIEQIDKLLKAMKNDSMLPLVRFYLLTGVRLREALSLMGQDVDFRRQVIYIRGRNTKSKRNRTIHFGHLPELKGLLEDLNPSTNSYLFESRGKRAKKGSAWHPDWVNHHISQVMTSLGWPWATTHTLRHTFASHLVMAGVEMTTVSKILGHSSIQVTERNYIHLAPKHVSEAMASIPYKNSGGLKGG